MEAQQAGVEAEIEYGQTRLANASSFLATVDFGRDVHGLVFNHPASVQSLIDDQQHMPPVRFVAYLQRFSCFALNHCAADCLIRGKTILKLV